MSKINEEFMKQQLTGSIGGDEDFLYEQYIAQEKMNEEYWQWKSVQSHSIFPDEVQYDDEYYKSTYIPTKEEEDENYIRTIINETNKRNGHT
jgi:hypothetical protein